MAAMLASTDATAAAFELPEVSDVIAAARDAHPHPSLDGGDSMPEQYNEMIQHIARTGEVTGDWGLVRRVIALKMFCLLQAYFSQRGFAGLKEHKYEKRAEELLLLLDRFDDAPFTIQRLAEVLMDASQYQSTHKLMNCFEKLLSVTSTIHQEV